MQPATSARRLARAGMFRRGSARPAPVRVTTRPAAGWSPPL